MCLETSVALVTGSQAQLPRYLQALWQTARDSEKCGPVCDDAIIEYSATCDLPESNGQVDTSSAAHGDLAAATIESLHAVFEASYLSDSEDAKRKAEVTLELMLANDALHRLALVLADLDGQSQTRVVELFAHVSLQAKSLGLLDEFHQHVIGHPALLDVVLEACAEQAISTHGALLLRALMSHRELLGHIWQSSVPLRLIELAADEDEISAQSFASLQALLLGHKEVACECLGNRFDKFFGSYHKLLDTKSATVRQQALGLLASVLLDRAYAPEMIRYVGCTSFLRIHAKLLWDMAEGIYLDAFHVFKIFVGNPRKPNEVQQVLARGSEQLVGHLECVMLDSVHAENLGEDLTSVISILLELRQTWPVSSFASDMKCACMLPALD